MISTFVSIVALLLLLLKILRKTIERIKVQQHTKHENLLGQ